MRSRARSRRWSVWSMRLSRTTTAVVTPTVTHTAASTSMSMASSRPRSVQARGSTRRFEDITRPAHRMDHRFAAGVDLLAQVRDVQLDDVRLAAEVVVPHPVEDLRLAQHPLRVAHQV